MKKFTLPSNLPAGMTDPSMPKEINMDVWDTAGQEEYMALTRTFFQGAHCVIITFSVDSPKSFSSVQTHLDNITQYCGENVLKVLVANKCDLEQHYITFDDMKYKAEELDL